MNWKLASSLVLLAVLFAAPLAFNNMSPAAAQSNTITVAVDLSHGESDKYLGYIQGNITFVNWVNITEGPITTDMLQGVDVLILGQPTIAFSPDEMDAIAQWLASGKKVLWVAGDSDYGSGNATQVYVNDLLEYIGAKLRVEYASFYDDIHNAQRFYRVLVHVQVDNNPDLETSMIAEGITKPILAHGPAPLIWVDDEGNPHDPVTETFDGLIRILWSYDTAYIGDNNPPLPLVYDPILYGHGAGNFTFVFLAAEYHPDTNDVIVVSGESPYGDYEPTWSWEYYGVALDGPKFVTNMISWFKTLITEVFAATAPSQTVTVTKTVTKTSTVTVTETTTKTETSVKTTTATVTETTTATETVTETTTSPTTVTVEKTNTGLVIGAVILVLIIVAAAVYFLRK
ncbi:MAG: GldG family protein [Desulfurococcales archaeon]|nr:GldG family protein [Desulfurococcales archaeon]